ncbi:phosphoacetylglucosamine mutase [Episyrphus balteatus]|uniref:phosphoacetylglucosamine mutase n=1 Tax=Episyrphus balteatus TaxID=286459 RepID=UPI0024855CFE|nr:phosphoacetylglucosamine mutase [Episyrphus balteatus]
MSINLRTIYAFAREMYPKNSTEKIQYGTAGFRGKAEFLDSVMFRMGVLATLRSRLRNGAVIGVMITASHNPEPDNGVKLIDPKGEMLEESWEKIATHLVNISDQELEVEVGKIIKENNIDVGSSSHVYVGMDNRYHSPRLLKAVADGVIAVKGNVKEFGIVTTPMMHYFVVSANTKCAYGMPTEEGYYTKLIKAFESIRGDKLENLNYKNKLLFDGANGVGARKMLQFLKRMKNSLNVEVFNSGAGKINHECGADHVKVQQCCPIGMPTAEPNTRCVSVDGDADRIVYFFTDEDGQFNLLDGDRIATLVADYLMNSVKKVGLELSMGLVQTAYANGASTDYIKNDLKVPVACVPTGVKHLHHKALDYDIGVYFEANGHGTIVFSDKAKSTIKKAAAENNDNENAKILLNVIDLINETVGDAISDMLLVETILHAKGWDVKDWLRTYTDLPNLQLKVKVQDRNVITTTDAERVCVTPVGLQDEIDKVVANYKRGRAFVRPSGTEDIVRVYAEASTKEDVDNLAYQISELVYKMAGGVGPEPLGPAVKINSHI